jgi:hypothetical protein
VTAPLSADGVAAFKRALEAIDPGDFLAWRETAAPPSSDVAAFLSAERARLVKLKSLGLTQGTDARLALIDGLLAEARREAS